MNKNPLSDAFQTIADEMNRASGIAFDMSDMKDYDKMLQLLTSFDVEAWTTAVVEKLEIIEDRLDDIVARLAPLEAV